MTTKSGAKKSTKKPAAKNSATKAEAKSKTMDAIKLLQSDHAEVKADFNKYEKLKTNSEKKALAEKICKSLKVHTQIEDEIFYPAARKATKDGDLLDEAKVEHACAKTLIDEIEAMKPSQKLYDAKVKVLGEQVKHHVKEEEGDLFPEVRKTKLDLEKLGSKMAKRKAVLMEEMETSGN